MKKAERLLTDLEIGIHVKISPDELKKLREKSGFLSREAYIPSYEEISLENEVGRFLFFRFFEEKE
jgi:hypothetical protein